MVLTLFSLWLGWQANRVARRTAMIEEVLARGGMINNAAPHIRNGSDYHTADGDRRDRLPRMWVVMGAKPISRIMVPIGEFSEPERLHIKAVFPEIGDGLGLPSERHDAR